MQICTPSGHPVPNSNIPKAEGLTAIEAWVIVCVLFVFGALIEYAGLLLKMKLETSKSFKPKGQVNYLFVRNCTGSLGTVFHAGFRAYRKS
jgi:hypothetical protein